VSATRDQCSEPGMDQQARQPASSVLVVMGVSGSGKTTIGALLAERLNCAFADGDDFHPPANVEKMHGGVPLTDEDRWPWLRAIAAWIDQTCRAGGHGVVACSALKRCYRNVLLDRSPAVRLIYLRGEPELIGRRLATRHGHFMPESLLLSQYEALEEPGPDENPITVDVVRQPSEIVDRILALLSKVPHL
jgi:gluconokinase